VRTIKTTELKDFIVSTLNYIVYKINNIEKTRTRLLIEKQALDLLLQKGLTFEENLSFEHIQSFVKSSSLGNVVNTNSIKNHSFLSTTEMTLKRQYESYSSNKEFDRNEADNKFIINYNPETSL
jgi:hypothetical protein